MALVQSERELRPEARLSERRDIRWVLAHEPVTTFKAAAEWFARTLREQTNGALQVNILSASDCGPERASFAPLIAWDLCRGRIEMTQTYTPILGQFAPTFWMLDLPFLFKDHAHAEKILDGEIGRRLLLDLLPFNIRGLAFTYSGGFRVVATTGREIHRWEDFEGLKIRTSTSPVAMSVLESVGARPIPGPSNDIVPMAKAGQIEAAETTYPRYWSLDQHKTFGVVNETYHSLFLTALAVNEQFFQSLSPSHRIALEKAARHTAVLERAKSIKEGEEAKIAAERMGVKITNLTDRERSRFQERAEQGYARFEPLFGKKTIDQIRSAR